MAWSYTNVFGAYSPLRGGTPISNMAGGLLGATAAVTAGAGLVSTTLSSVKMVTLTTYGEASAVVLKSISSNGMIDINVAAPAASGSWLVFGI